MQTRPGFSVCTFTSPIIQCTVYIPRWVVDLPVHSPLLHPHFGFFSMFAQPQRRKDSVQSLKCIVHCAKFTVQNFEVFGTLKTIAMQSWSTRLTKHSKVQSPTICLLRWLLIGLQSPYLAVNTVETVAWYGDKKLKKKEITKIWKCKCFWCYIWSWGAPVNLLKFLSLFPLTQFFSSAAAMNTVWIKSPYKIIMLAEEILW